MRSPGIICCQNEKILVIFQEIQITHFVTPVRLTGRFQQIIQRATRVNGIKSDIVPVEFPNQFFKFLMDLRIVQVLAFRDLNDQFALILESIPNEIRIEDDVEVLLPGTGRNAAR